MPAFKIALVLLLLVINVSTGFAAEPPVITLGTTEQYPCPGAATTITTEVKDAGANPSFVWFVDDAVVFNETGPTLAVKGAEGRLTIKCKVTNNTTGLSTTSAPLVIDYLNYPAANIQIYYLRDNYLGTDNGNYCSGAEIRFGASFFHETHPPDILFQWQVNGIVVLTTSQGAFNTKSLVKGDEVTCKIIFPARCRPVNTVISNALNPIITTSADASVSVSAEQPGLCIGPLTTYIAAPLNVGDSLSYEWTVNGVKAGTNSDKLNGAALKPGDRIICKARGVTRCNVNEVISNEIVLGDVLPEINNTVTISSSAKNNIILPGQLINFSATAAYHENVAYQWLVNGAVAGANTPEFSSNGLNNGDVVSCRVISSRPCVIPLVATSNAITVLIKQPITLPNTFTPNGDGINDTWNITALLAYPGCTINVYNRYGGQVYHSLNYVKGWDGSVNGKPLPAGPYYYLINPNDGSGKIAGCVTILK